MVALAMERVGVMEVVNLATRSTIQRKYALPILSLDLQCVRPTVRRDVPGQGQGHVTNATTDLL